MIVYIAGLQAIPGSLNEAAMIDGANKWQLSHSCYDSKHDAFYYNLYIFNNYKLI